MTKNPKEFFKVAKQTDLEDAIARAPLKLPQRELSDAFNGELFQPKCRNHYEDPDPVPFAPALDLHRPTIRQRIENLINRDPGLLQRYVNEVDDGSVDMDVPDDPEAPLTGAEQVYVDMVAAEIAEQAPLPDDGLPRPDPGPVPAAASKAAEAAPGGHPAAPGPAQDAGDSAGRPAPGPAQSPSR